jgi:predicted Zn-dependent protease
MTPSGVQSFVAALVCVSVHSLSAAGVVATRAEPPYPPARLQAMVDRLAGELTLSATVRVALVPKNPLLVSVEQVIDDGGAPVFLMAFEEGFLDELSEDEVVAIVAHELGHVWIFLHHPYLQTERQANRIAMRVVSRESLERVYEKVWARDGAKGDLTRFLGQ